MIDHTSILSGALIDYNDWRSRQTNEMVGSPSDLRGIFYNKLVTRLKEGYTTIDLRSAIKPEHLIMSFSARGYIASLSFTKEREAYSPTFRNEILNGLKEALFEVDVTDFQDKVSYELSKVILELKKSLNHGGKQNSKC